MSDYKMNKRQLLNSGADELATKAIVLAKYLQRGYSEHEIESAFDVVQKANLRGLQMGDLVADYLNLIGITNDEDELWQFPIWFYYDLSLALQLVWWEKVGFIDLLPGQLPHSSDVFDRIFADAQNPVTLAENQPDQRLGIRMLSLYRRYLAHCQPPGLRTEFHLGQPKPDDLVEVVAQFLVRTRHHN